VHGLPRRGEGAFDQVPHDSRGTAPPTCVRCHGLNLKELKDEFHESVHAVRMRGEFGCGECHEAHSMPRERNKLSRETRTELANRSCLRCHRDADFRIAARHDGKTPPSNTHEWLPNLDKHARMRCVVCHNPDRRGLRPQHSSQRAGHTILRRLPRQGRAARSEVRRRG
jgi:predicted CXXCH cytochrome family protein